MFKKLFLVLFILSSVPVSLVGCSKDEKKSEETDKKKKSDDDDDDKGKSKKKKKGDDDSSDDDDSKSKKKKKKADDDDDSKKKDEDGDSKKKDDTASDEDSTGIKACDDYLTRYMKCMPGDKKTKTDAVKQMRDAWKKGAAVAAAKDGIKEGCTKSNEALDKIPGCK
jgi:Ni/Co efflux regulator RcnB